MENIKIAAEIRLATNSDLLVGPSLLRFGQPYYINDLQTKQFSGVYVLDQFTSSIELEKLYQAGLIYVPVIPMNHNINIVLHQNDLKAFQKNGHALYKEKNTEQSKKAS